MLSPNDKTPETFQHKGKDDPREIRKKRRSLAKGKFHRVCRKFKQSVHEEDPKGVLTDLLADLEKSYSEVESKTEDYIEILDESVDSAKIKELHDDMDVLYRELYDIKAIMSRKQEKDKQIKEASVGATKECTPTLKVKKLDAPEFSGAIREYPSFKRDYERHMVASYGKDPFALKSCLSGEALRTVKGVDDSYNEMFHRLDLKYGRPEKQADAVLSELRRLKQIPEGNDRIFVETVDVIEQCYLDLKKISLEGEMNTATMVSEIEKLLPRVQRREWAIRKQRDSSGRNTFASFLEFLLEEKHAIEYMENDLRNAEKVQRGKVNSVSAETGHVNTVTDYSLIQDRLDRQEAMLQQVLSEMAKPGTTKRFSGSVRRCWYHDSDKHEITECTAFKQLDTKSKFDLLRKNGVCFSCLRPGHLSSKCRDRNVCNVNGCEQMHHQILHDSDLCNKQCCNVVNESYNRNENVLLMLSEVSCSNGKLNTLWDPGSNMSLITHQSVHRLKLKGKPITLTLTKVGNNSKTIQSQEYVVPLLDKIGQEWKIHAYGIEQITADIGTIRVDKVSKLFRSITEEDLKRPTGSVDLLVGTDCCTILPEKVAEVGNLQLMKNQFGYCLRGKHELLNTGSGSCNTVHIHFASGIISNQRTDLLISDITNNLGRFFEIESMGTECSPKCGGCKCGKCPTGGKEYTIKDERDLTLISRGLKHDQDSKTWIASYPWIRNPCELKNNYVNAKSRLEALERRLSRNGKEYVALYCRQIKDMLEREVARKLTKEEVDMYSGPVFYLPHHEISKPGSKTTPLRIVFNSSSSFMGLTLNDFWAKGPNIVNDLVSVLCKFRKEKVALVGDISKMYNAVKISELDQHTHRFLWRDMDQMKKPDHYVMQAVAFGDRPSGAIAVTALRKTAELSCDTYPEAADIIMNNSYVDDILHSAESLTEAKAMAKDIDCVLAEGKFLVKHWTISGQAKDVDKEESSFSFEEERVLGMTWEPIRDVFRFKARLNFSRKIKNNHTDIDLTREDLPDRIPKILTQRMVLSQLAGLFDPLGLITPFVLQGKLLMRMLCSENNQSSGKGGWDEPISEDMRHKWIQFFSEMFDIELLEFPRCLKSDSVIDHDPPILIIFSDGSKYAFGACAYIRWKNKFGSYGTQLVIAKSRIAPLKQLSIPRLELCGALLGTRLREKLTKNMNLEFGRIFHVVDSMIVKAQVQKESYGFGTFTATRIAEIQSKTKPEDWWWIPGDMNPADLTTRATSPSELGINSFWQNGPAFLSKPTDEWPIVQECYTENVELPDTCPTMKLAHATKIEISHNKPRTFVDIDINKFSSMTKLLRVTCILIRICKRKSFLQDATKISPNELQDAENEWCKFVQADLRPDWRTAYCRLGVELSENGLIVVGTRMTEWLKATWNRTNFILLPSNAKFTELYMKSMHDSDHAGIDHTLAKIRSKFWIPGARKYLKLIARNCIVCRKKNKVLEGQVMSSLPIERMKPSPPFYYSAVDLFGPFTIRDSVKKRTNGKAYGVIFTCLSSRAVYLDISESYSTDSFMLTLRRFVSLRGLPRKMRSDVGTQLVAAKKEISDMTPSIDWNKVGSFGENKGLEWEFCKSADAPWENGCCEALIKSVKTCLSSAIGSSVMTFAELQTVMFEVGNHINERPIGIKGNDPNEGSYLCPNDLLLGRSSTTVPPGSWTSKECFKLRWKFVQQVVDSFWKRWIRDFFPTLIVRQKWHISKRNLQIGDVVMVQDSNMIRGQWKLAQVCEANPGKDGKVRDVQLRYKVTDPLKPYHGCEDTRIRRSAHRLVVILPVEEQ